MAKLYSVRESVSKTLLKDGDYTSIRQAIERIARIVPDNEIFAELDQNKKLKVWNARQVYEEICNLGDGLIALGHKDAHIAIVSENCVRYVLIDTCVSNGVGVVTPLDKDAPDDLLATLLSKCEATAVFAGSDLVGKIQRLLPSLPLLKTIITIDRKVDGLPFYDEIMEAGAALENKIYATQQLDLDAPSKILFTSGTTGANKGVVLTQRNLTANMLNCMDAVKINKGIDDRSMSILPMHHATEINTHIMARVGAGNLTYINGNMRNMMANMKIFRPGIITVVPMIANAFYKNIWANARLAGKAEKLEKGIRLCNALRKIGIDPTQKIFKDIYAPFGGKLRLIVCGGSMLNPNVVKGMNDLGIMIHNGYGITECGPLISMNADTLDEHLSVGRAVPAIEARIDNPDENGIGELCVKGPSVATGYYKDPEATAKVFLPDGFFNTGDSARMDAKGRIFLAGRKKNTIVLESGKNICPEEVENIVETAIDYASDIVVYQAEYSAANGASTKVICCGVYIPDETVRADRERIKADFIRLNATLPNYKKIDYVELSDTEYPKTSTKKIKRTVLPEQCSGKGIKID